MCRERKIYKGKTICRRQKRKKNFFLENLGDFLWVKVLFFVRFSFFFTPPIILLIFFYDFPSFSLAHSHSYTRCTQHNFLLVLITIERLLFRFSLTKSDEIFWDSSSISSIHRRWPRILKLGSIVFPRGIVFIFTFISLSGLSSALVFFARLNNYLYTQGENCSWPAGSTPQSN